jgi:hypothetical protein
MIDCAIATYVDNQEAVGYPVSYITNYWSDFAEIFWLASDVDNAMELRAMRDEHPMADRIKVATLGVKITKPCHLMLAYGESVAFLQRTAKSKFVAFQEADVCFTDHGIDTIKRQLEDRRFMGMPAIKSVLYHETKTWNHPHGCVIFPRNATYEIGPDSDWQVRLKNFGASQYEANWELKHTSDDLRMMIDLSYFSVGMYERKLVSHNRLWPDQFKVDCKAAFNRSFGEGARMAVARFKQECGDTSAYMVEYAGQYKRIIDDLGLRDEYAAVKDAMAA